MVVASEFTSWYQCFINFKDSSDDGIQHTYTMRSMLGRTVIYSSKQRRLPGKATYRFASGERVTAV